MEDVAQINARKMLDAANAALQKAGFVIDDPDSARIFDLQRHVRMVGDQPIIDPTFIKEAKAAKPHLFAAPALPDAHSLSPEGVKEALRGLSRDEAQRHDDRVNERFVESLKRKYGTHTSDTMALPQRSGTVTGTTTVAKHAPQPSAGSMSGDAREMSDSEWQAAVRALNRR